MLGGLLSVGALAAGIIAIIAGVIILVWPRIIAYVVGVYFIIVGLITRVSVLR